MQDEIHGGIESAVREVELALARGDYQSIGSESRRSRLAGEDIAAVLEEYGGVVMLAPQSHYDSERTDPIHTRGPDPPRWHMDFDLWIDGQHSDLTVTMEVTYDEAGRSAR